MSRYFQPAIPSRAGGRRLDRHFRSPLMFAIRKCHPFVAGAAPTSLQIRPKTRCQPPFTSGRAAGLCVDCILLSKIVEGDAMNELVGRIRAEFLEMPGLRLT